MLLPMRRNLSEELTPDRLVDVSRETNMYEGKSPEDRGEAIRKARQEGGWTRAALARRIGVQDRTVARWEHDGTDQNNLVIAFQAMRALRLNMEGVIPGKGIDLSKVSTLDLTVELERRARVMEARDRAYLEMRNNLERDGLKAYIHPGL